MHTATRWRSRRVRRVCSSHDSCCSRLSLSQLVIQSVERSRSPLSLACGNRCMQPAAPRVVGIGSAPSSGFSRLSPVARSFAAARSGQSTPCSPPLLSLRTTPVWSECIEEGGRRASTQRQPHCAEADRSLLLDSIRFDSLLPPPHLHVSCRSCIACLALFCCRLSATQFSGSLPPPQRIEAYRRLSAIRHVAGPPLTASPTHAACP